MVIPVGLEPTTQWLKAICSTNWAMGPIWLGYQGSNLGILEPKSSALPTWLYPNGGRGGIRTLEPLGAGLQPDAFDHFATLPGADDRNRTCNLLITSQLLYLIEPHQHGGARQTRTVNPLLVRQVLYPIEL